jgi:broad specificity phosphatase PhoE
MRVKPGQHLSQAGVDLARRTGETMGSFNRVVTSTIPRAYETAIAMGFAVDEQNEVLSLMPEIVERALGNWEDGIELFLAQPALQSEVVRQYVEKQAAFVRDLARQLPDNGAALVISHGGIVEAQVIGCLPEADFHTWGRIFDYCEGARLAFDGNQFISGQILRAQDAIGR